MTPVGTLDASTVLVIGAGPAGLATSRELTVRGIDHRVLERGATVGHVWANLYDGLVLHTGKHLSALPGLPFPASTALFPTRRQFVEYLQRYAETFAAPVTTAADVIGVERTPSGWAVRTSEGDELRARMLVTATGIVSNPQMPAIPRDERFPAPIIHSAEYRRPGPFSGQRVLVVGCGNSAGEIATELAEAGVHVTIAVRSGARVVPRELLGLPIQYLAVVVASLPTQLQRGVNHFVDALSRRLRGPAVLPPPASSKCSNIPLIGFHLVDAIRSGSIHLKGGVSAFTAGGVQFADGSIEPFDAVILATGYKASLQALGSLVRTDVCGFGSRHDRVVSSDQPDLYFVGHNYDMRGGLRNIAQDATLTATMIARSLT